MITGKQLKAFSFIPKSYLSEAILSSIIQIVGVYENELENFPWETHFERECLSVLDSILLQISTTLRERLSKFSEDSLNPRLCNERELLILLKRRYPNPGDLNSALSEMFGKQRKYDPDQLRELYQSITTIDPAIEMKRYYVNQVYKYIPKAYHLYVLSFLFPYVIDDGTYSLTKEERENFPFLDGFVVDPEAFPASLEDYLVSFFGGGYNPRWKSVSRLTIEETERRVSKLMG